MRNERGEKTVRQPGNLEGKRLKKVVDLLLRTTDTHFLKRPKDDSGEKSPWQERFGKKTRLLPPTLRKEGGKNRRVSSDPSVEARRSKESERSILDPPPP